jgi:transketolase
VTKNIRDTIKLATDLSKDVLKMTHRAKASHIGSCLSMVDIIAVLYGQVLTIDPKNPNWEKRDRFILSKGHATAIVYAALARRGFFPMEWLMTYCENASPLAGHITHKHAPGVEVSSGSLGHGLPIACGMAYAILHHKENQYVYVVMSDGEMDEGTTWEAILFAAHHKLSNIIVFIDYNKIQSFGRTNDVINLEPLIDKWKAFNWHTQEINGHDHTDIIEAIERAKNNDRPSVIVAHTIKGKGISFMEDKLIWHYKSPNDAELELALKELDT